MNTMKFKIQQYTKNSLKKLLVLALLVVSVSSFAQDQAQPEKKSNKPKKEKLTQEQKNQVQLDKLTVELNLDAKQQEQIKPILAEQSAKREGMQGGVQMRDLSDQEREALRQKRKEERVELENKLKAVLSPEQFKKMKSNEEANREKMREAREARENRQQE